MGIRKQGKGTGTIRKERMALLTVTWSECEHFCPFPDGCGTLWMHKIQPIPWPGMYAECHLGAFSLCGGCLEYPNMYGKPLTATKKIKR